MIIILHYPRDKNRKSSLHGPKGDRESTVYLLVPHPLLHAIVHHSTCIYTLLLSLTMHIIARAKPIPGRVFAFITVRQTKAGTSCLRMRQIFIVFVVGKNLINQ